jgi:two-component system OmpR family sensor kinase
MALNNILQNAINYGEGIVNVTLDEDPNLVIIRVSDNGKGVPENLRDQIVKPFVRGTKLESQNKGHGVGLAIVKRVVEWHNGHLGISDSIELSGATFTLSLPKNKQ